MALSLTKTQTDAATKTAERLLSRLGQVRAIAVCKQIQNSAMGPRMKAEYTEARRILETRQVS